MFFRRTAPLRDAAARWPAVADSIRLRFVRRVAEVPASLPNAAQQRALRRLDSLRTSLTRGDLRAKQFDITTTSDDESYVVFSATADSIVISDSLPAGQGRRALCWMALEAADLTQMTSRKDQLAFLAFLDQRVMRWENFRTKGMQMLPVELVLNSHWGFARRPLEPPPAQWILLHPSVGLEMPFPLDGSVHGREALLFELVGAVKYVNDWRFFIGAAPAVSLMAGRGPAWGGVLHLGRLGHIGVLYRRHGERGRGEAVLALSPTLYNPPVVLGDSMRVELDRLRGRLTMCGTDVQLCTRR